MENASRRQVRYGVAMSLDGYIADPSGEADWITMDPDVDFAAMYARFDTLLIGRRTYEAMLAMGGGGGGSSEIRPIVISRTLRPEDHPGVEIVDDGVPFVAELKNEPGKDIWLFGGGGLLQSLLEAELVDGVDVGVMPVLLGGGTPFVATPVRRARLALKNHKVLPNSGIVTLEYDVVPG